jgi:hypothetical protein
MTLIYCLKCHKKTPTKNEKTISENGRKRCTGICSICGTNKSQFVAAGSQKGKGFVDKFVENNPVELHLLVTDPKTGKPVKSSFIGPGTKLEKRLIPGTNTPQEWSKPKDELDAAALQHDIAYRDHKDPASRNAADKILQQKARQYLKKPNLSTLNRIDGHIVDKAMTIIKRKV